MKDGHSFEDAEPEDAWDAEDPVPLQIDNLFLRLAVLDGDVMGSGRIDLLDIIEARLKVWKDRYDGESDRVKLRIDQLAEDLAFIRGRVDG